MTIKDLIAELQRYDQDMPVITPGGYKPDLHMMTASLEWTTGGDPHSYYIRNPNGDLEVLAII